jgi:hypothetical protein
MGGGGPGPRPAVPAWGIVSALRIYRRRSVQIQAAKTNRATMQTAIPARTIASNGSMAASMPAQAPGGNPGGRIGAQPFAQADTLRGRHPRPHQSTGAADPDQGGGAGGRGENRGGGSGVSICPQKLSLWDATKERMAASPGGGGVVVLRRIKWAEKNDNAQPYSAVRMGRHDTKHVQGWGVVTQSAERRHGWQAAGMARRTQRGAGGRHLQHPVQGRA